jgi:diguanylate cyclase (GGDEF)-like protein
MRGLSSDIRDAVRLFLGVAVLAVASVAVPGPVSAGALLIVAGLAFAMAGVAAFVPWRRWSPRASLVLAVPVFAIIAGCDAAGIVPAAAQGLPFVLTFTWIGAHHPPRTAWLVAPLAAAAYAIPPIIVRASPRFDPQALVLVIAMCVFVAETIARATARRYAVERDLRQLADYMAHTASHDALTGLPNRALLTERLVQTLARASRTTTPAAVLFVDLDGFKAVNDGCGHDAGDAVLTEIARRFVGVTRAGDTVARYGGDEFVFVLDAVTSMAEARAFADRIASVLGTPFGYAGSDFVLRATVGVALSIPGITAEELLVAADRAMYDARSGTRR